MRLATNRVSNVLLLYLYISGLRNPFFVLPRWHKVQGDSVAELGIQTRGFKKNVLMPMEFNHSYISKNIDFYLMYIVEFSDEFEPPCTPLPPASGETSRVVNSIVPFKANRQLQSTTSPQSKISPWYALIRLAYVR